MNCRSINNKVDLVHDYLVENSVDCAALTETWLYGDDRDNAMKIQLVPAGYKFLHVASWSSLLRLKLLMTLLHLTYVIL